MTERGTLQANRDANLQKLKKAVGDWIGKEMKRLDDEVAFMREVLKGRGATEAATKNLNEATAVAVSDIDAFITGE